jgi:hypothetical protein
MEKEKTEDDIGKTENLTWSECPVPLFVCLIVSNWNSKGGVNGIKLVGNVEKFIL